MSRQDPAGIHFFSFWASRAADPRVPLWLRLTALAYSAHTKNGHATFYLGGESTLPEVLGKGRRHIQKEIMRAVELGYLSGESNVNCLVLPDEICGGSDGHQRSECKLHGVSKSETRDGSRPAETLAMVTDLVSP